MPTRKTDLLGRLLSPFDILLTAVVAVVTLEVLVEVVFRYVLQKPLAWGAEVSQTLLVWVTFIGAAPALYRGEHMVITLVVNKIPSPALRRAFIALGRLVVLAFLVLGVWAGWLVVERTWGMRTTTLQIPAGVLYLAFPVGCLLMIIVALRDLVRFRKE
jgi:TRAP-type transport system small permease protein